MHLTSSVCFTPHQPFATAGTCAGGAAGAPAAPVRGAAGAPARTAAFSLGGVMLMDGEAAAGVLLAAAGPVAGGVVLVPLEVGGLGGAVSPGAALSALHANKATLSGSTPIANLMMHHPALYDRTASHC
jgi:hypothetical protein